MRGFLSNILVLILAFGMFPELYAKLPEMITTRKSSVAPGVVQKTLEAPEKPWVIHVLEVDLKSPFIHIENVDGGGLEQPSFSTGLKGRENYRLVAAVNGDFFQSGGRTVNANISGGEIVCLEHYQSDPRVYWPAFGVNKDKKLCIGYHIFEGSAAFSDTVLPVLGINEYPGPGGLALYNSHAGNELKFEQGVYGIRLKPLNEWVVNGSVYCMMDSLILDSCSVSLQQGQAYLSGTAWTGNILRQQFQKGRLVKLELIMHPFEDLSDTSVSFNRLPQLPQLKEMIGGYPVIVRNGENYALEGFANANGTNSFATDRHPRTAVGFNRDTTKMYMLVVDGRQSHSIGMNLPDLADVLIGLGAWQGLNLDGGGSSVFIVENKIMNSPSDGRERAVRNSCAVYSSAPEGDIVSLQIELDSLWLYQGESFRLYVSGRDEYDHYREIPDSLPLTFHYNPELGSMSVRGDTIYFTASERGGEGLIYAKLGNELRSEPLYVNVRSFDPIFLEPERMITDTLQPLVYKVKGIDENGDTVEIPNRVLHYSLSDEGLGMISEQGVFYGKNAGEAKVIVSYGAAVDSADIRVCSTEGELLLEHLNSLDGWIVADHAPDALTANMSLQKIAPSRNAMHITYYTILGGKIYLEKNIPISGSPEMLIMDINTAGQSIPVTLELADAKGETYKLKAAAQAGITEFQRLFFPLADLKDVSPLTIKRISFGIRGSELRGSFSWYGLRVLFPSAVSISSLPPDPETPLQFGFWPQKLNSGDSLQSMFLELPQRSAVKIEIFNIKGELLDLFLDRKLDAGYHTIRWNSGGLPKGIYFYRLISAEKVLRGKLLVF